MPKAIEWNYWQQITKMKPHIWHACDREILVYNLTYFSRTMWLCGIFLPASKEQQQNAAGLRLGLCYFWCNSTLFVCIHLVSFVLNVMNRTKFWFILIIVGILFPLCNCEHVLYFAALLIPKIFQANYLMTYKKWK